AISTALDDISETISVRLHPEVNHYFGDSPNGLAVSQDGNALYVTNGMDNAIAVINPGKMASTQGVNDKSSVEGYIPTGAYPSSVSISTDGKLYVTNLEGRGAQLPVPAPSSEGVAFNAHHMLASVSIIDIPDEKQLERYTNTVIAVNQMKRLTETQLPARTDILPKPVPERIGEPSAFKHVVYIIKENRTYDQVLGDIPGGNGDTALCIYGRKVTPNTHQLASDFVLMDNYMAAGKCSAEGHQWTDASIVTDYIEKNVRAWFRSYPHVQTDALVYAPTGFLWDNAVKHGKKVKIYGEAATPVFDEALTWKDIYTGFLDGDNFAFHNKTTIDPVRPLLSKTYPGYDHHKIPDVLRADAFVKDWEKYEQMEGDSIPDLMVVALPNDHTAGTRPGFPTPRAMVADNDLALGMIIEAITDSRFWQNTVVFVTEDDSQDGWDHLSAYRTVGLVISPYSRLNKPVHTAYNQPSMVRTIEQILGLPPMNIQDAIAAPMTACFDSTANLQSWQHSFNQIPLDEMNPKLESLNGKAKQYAKQSMQPQFNHIDSGNDDMLNRILWFSAKGHTPYPKTYAGDDEEK
ncbi:MAG TPA: alkaline phosphatase family protein, partial [Bacteroidales bacterium]|nr:alkaline phosphatase family protein [Bacteroidales bacterium]